MKTIARRSFPRRLLGLSLSVATSMALLVVLLGTGDAGHVQAQTTAASPDREALVALYNATNGDNWTDKENWLSDEPLGEWQGVSTDDEGRIIKLELWVNNLTGTIPSELGNLSNLNVLELRENQLRGAIPPELGNLSNLTDLQLCCNELSGEIPEELGSLTNLVVVGLDENQLSGEIPSELGNLSNLTELYLYENQLNGEIPSELGNLPNLIILYLFTNQLSGGIPPELGSLPNLTELALQDNQLNGTIPPELGNLVNLEHLGLWGNQLTGNIPPQLGNLSNLRELWLGSNQLTGPIPPELGNLSNLTELLLEGNQLSGEIPPTLGDLSNLTELYIHDNQLSGTIPLSFTSLTSLEDFYFENNADLCAQDDVDFQSWLQAIPNRDNGPNCEASSPSVVSYAFQSFHAISHNLDEYGDHDAECKSRLGNQYRLADWNDLKSWVDDGGSIPDLIAGLRLSWEGVGAGPSVYPHDGNGIDVRPRVSYNGNGRWNNGRRHFFISRQDHVRPSYFLAHDHIDNNHITLGSWFGVGGTVLCYDSSSEVPESTSFGNFKLTTGKANYPHEAVAAVQNEFGSEWRVADWNDLRAVWGAHQDSIKTAFEGGATIVTWNGEAQWGNTQRTFFVEDHNGSKPGYFLAHDELGGHEVSLGSWTIWEWGHDGLRTLAIRRDGAQPPTDPTPVHAGDKPALVALYNATGGDSWTVNTNWLSDAPLDEWSGVVAEGDVVLELSLSGNQLSGEIPPELGNLSRLRELALVYNQLSGEIPPELGNLSSLFGLYLEGNQLSGEIPPELSNLTSLFKLYLGENSLTGQVPSELGKLSGLEQLQLHSNQLSGEIPAELGDLAYLRELYLGSNQLSGEIPVELGNLFSLTVLSLSGNQLMDEIPSELGNLSNLTELYVHDNQLSGTIPLSFTGLTALEDFYFDNNAGLCAPDDTDFQNWLQAILNRDDGPNCETLSTTLWERLAHKYAPVLRMHPDEKFFPKGVEALIDNAELKYHDEDVPHLTVTFQDTVTPEMLAPETLDVFRDRLDQQLADRYDGANWYLDVPDSINSTPQAGYPPKVYATIRDHIPGKVYLQYYLFYYYDHLKPGFTQDNCEAIGIPICQPHEADWELIQLQFEASSVAEALNRPPSRLAYSQHGWSEDSAYEDIPTVDGHPAAYVAHGKHANYYGPDPDVTSAGTSGDPWSLSISQDQISDRGKTLLPSTLSNVYGDHCPSDEAGRILACTYTYQLELIDETRPWVAYEGGWGDSKIHGPDHPYRWDTPHDWMTNANHPPVGGIEWTEGVLASLNLEDESGGQRDSAILNAAFYHWFFPRPVPNRNFPIPEWSRALIPSDPHARVTEFEYSNRKTLLEPYFFNSHYPRTIPPLFGDLSHLQKLDIRGNDLTGSIPRQLGYLSNLRELYLNDNNLSGEIPFLLGALPNLETLYLAGSEFTGCIPDGLKDVEDNDFSELGMNFCDGTPVTVLSQPELVVKSVSRSVSSLNLGQDFTLTITVKNDGDATSEQTSLDFYRSTNSTISTIDDELGSLSVKSLAPGEETTVSTFITPVSSGKHYYGACIDPVPGDTDTQVNCKSSGSVTVRKVDPDLKVKSVSRSSRSVNLGQGFTLTIEVKNDGDATSEQTSLDFYRSTNSTISTIDDELGSLSLRSLAQGEETTVSTFVTPVSSGKHYYGACIDPVPGDTDTQVNCKSSGSVTVRKVDPDLKVKSVSRSSRSVNLGQGFTLTIEVKNDGDATSEQTSLDFYDSPGNSNITPGFDQKLGTLSIKSLTPNEETEVSTFVTPVSSGKHYYGACIDPVPGDTDTQVNCKSSGSVTVRKVDPDLKVKSVSRSSRSVNLGQGFTLTIEVKNDGDATSEQTSLDFYDSPGNSNITPGFDQKLGTLSIKSLTPNEETEVSTFVTPVSSGQHYYGACIDPVPGDTDTQVNCKSSGSVTVNEAPPDRDSAEIRDLGCRLVWVFGTGLEVYGTVYAKVPLDGVTVNGYGVEDRNRTLLGQQNLGSFSARQQKEFSITGLNLNYGGCAAVWELSR